MLLQINLSTSINYGDIKVPLWVTIDYEPNYSRNISEPTRITGHRGMLSDSCFRRRKGVIYEKYRTVD